MLKSRLEIARQWSCENFAILSLKPWLYVRILIYRTCAISNDLIFQPKHDHWTHKLSQPFFIFEGKKWKLWKCSQRYYGADHLKSSKVWTVLKGMGVGEGYRWFQTYFGGENISCKEIPGEKVSCTEKRIVYCAGIKSHTVVCPEVWEKKNLTQAKSPIPRLRSETGLKSWEFENQRWYKITPIYNLELGRWWDFSQCDKPVRVPFPVPARLTVGEIPAGKTNWSH